MKVTPEELSALQAIQEQYQKNKSVLADLEMKKIEITDNLRAIKNAFSKMEKQLIDTYGEDSVIDMKTGEVKKKEDE
jgi:hypothetical protein